MKLGQVAELGWDSHYRSVDPRSKAESLPSVGAREGGEEACQPAASDTQQLLIDAFTVGLAQPTALGSALAGPSAETTPRADYTAAIEDLVRRVSWGGDRRSGTARIEIGGGSLKGAAIVVHASGGRAVSVELELPAGSDPGGLELRLRERFAQRGIEVRAFTVR